jgi:hypothetical protein
LQPDRRRVKNVYRILANVDQLFFVFKKRPPGDEISEELPTRVGPPLTAGGVAIKGAWTPDGYYQTVGRPPIEGAAYGSWSGSDDNFGTLRLGPYPIGTHAAITIPVVTGPSEGGRAIRVLNSKTGAVISSLHPVPRHDQWWLWNVPLPHEPEAAFEIVAEDTGSAYGQWLAVGVPHYLVPQIGPELSGPIAVTSPWTKDGYPPDAGRPPVPGTIYSSWSGSDENVGKLHLGPFHVPQKSFVAIPLVTGRGFVNADLSLKVLNARTGKVIAYLDPPPDSKDWWAWKVATPDEPDAAIEMVAEDAGRGSGQWIAVGLPHVVQ